MEPFELQATTRKILGKKVKHLRRTGVIPVNVYGHGIESKSLQVEASALDKLLSQAAMTHLISLTIDEKKSSRNVIIKEVQRQGGVGKPIHVSFQQVRMKERIKVEVPIDFVGESPAVKAKQGSLLINLRAVEVECLPGSIPSSIVLDTSSLPNPGDVVYVKDLQIGQDIAFVTDPEQMVVKIEPIRAAVEEVVEEAEAKIAEVAQEESE